jgi:hypothetical protein
LNVGILPCYDFIRVNAFHLTVSLYVFWL